MKTFSVEQKLKAVEREVRYRKQVYPRLIEQQRLSPVQADLQIRVMEAIAEDYRVQAKQERLL